MELPQPAAIAQQRKPTFYRHRQHYISLLLLENEVL